MNETPQSSITEDSVSATPAAESPAPVATAEPSPPPCAPTGKKIPKALILGLAVCLVAALGLGIALAMGVFEKDPKTVVDNAFTATAAAQEKKTAALYTEIPALRSLTVPTPGAVAGDVDLTFRSIEGVENANLISQMLNGIGVRLGVSLDPAAHATQLNASAYLPGKELVNGCLFLSPDLVTGSVPTFSEKVLSISPSRFVEDFKKSDYYDAEYMDEAQISAIGAMISGYTEYFAALGNLSNEKLHQKMNSILEDALHAATYAKGEKKDGLTLYTITVPGADVKKAVIAYYEIYMDSEIGAAMRSIMQPMLEMTAQQADLTPSKLPENGSAYEESMKRMIDEIARNCPELNTTVALSIDSKQIIRAARLTASAATPAPIDALFVFNSAALEYHDNGTAETAVFTLDIVNSGMHMLFNMDMNVKSENKTRQFDLLMKMTSPEKDIVLTLPLTSSISADGKVAFDLQLALSGSGETMECAVKSTGTATLEGEKLTMNLPGTRISAKGMGLSTPFALTFDLTNHQMPLTSPLTVPADTVAFLSMTEDERATLLSEYQVGLQTLIGSAVSTLMMGNAPLTAPATPQ